MSAVGFIGRRLEARGTMPRSVQTMRTVAGIGIAVATAALVVALSIGRGFERSYKRALLDFNAHIVVMGIGEIDHPAAAIEALGQFAFRSEEEARLVLRFGWAQGPLAQLRAFAGAFMPARLCRFIDELSEASGRGVRAATPFLYREALAIGGGAIRGIVVKGVDPASMAQGSGMKILPFEPGRDLSELLALKREGPTPVVVGAALGEAMGAAKSATALRLLIPTADEKRDGRREFQEVLAVGAFESGIHDYDSDFLLMRIEDARRLFAVKGETVSGIEITLDDPERAAVVARAIEARLGQAYRAITWEELNGDLIAAVRLEKLVSSIIMGIMLVVASLNIVAALTLTALHRLREVALLKAIGLPEPALARLLTHSGLAVGLRGIAVGMLVGIGVAAAVGYFHLVPLEAEIYLIGSLPIDISGSICGILALFSAAAVLLASRFAATRLAKINPSEGLATAR
jgi:lipoprotein-releasing system permease protein